MALTKISATNIGSNAVANSIGYTPANKAGDTFTGNIIVNGSINANGNQITISDSGFGARLDLTNTGTGGNSFSQYSTSNAFSQGGGKWILYNGSVGGSYFLGCDTSGRITMPFQPAFQVRLSGSQTISGNLTRTKIAFDTIDYQNGNNYDTANYRFTAPVAGWYNFNYSVYAYSVSTNEITLWKNGSQYLRNAGITLNFNTNGITTSGSYATKLAVGDYVELYTQLSPGSQQLYHSSERPTVWSGYLIG